MQNGGVSIMTDTASGVEPLRLFSFGGGVQSVACLVLAAQDRIEFTDFVFANVGGDSEDPRTLDYLKRYARPYATTHGLRIHEVRKTRRDGSTETLWDRMTHEGSKSLPIPVRLSGGKPAKRSCTAEFKIRVISTWAKQHGASPEHPATVGLGISLDEIHRANLDQAQPHERLVYPLIDLPAGSGPGLHLRRTDCHRIIAAAGLPIPPKSSCFFCPFHREHAWFELRRTRPDLFEKACRLEELLSRRNIALGRGPVYLTDYRTPLRRLVPAGLQTLDDTEAIEDSGCNGGWCHT
jgi:hypothetical protein